MAFDRDLAVRKAIDRALRQHGVKVEVVMEFDNVETIKQAIGINAGVSILPRPTVLNGVGDAHAGRRRRSACPASCGRSASSTGAAGGSPRWWRASSNSCRSRSTRRRDTVVDMRSSRVSPKA